MARTVRRHEMTEVTESPFGLECPALGVRLTLVT